jgi:radical SAM protein with 4Fe4S-binding SPASM domain
MCFYHGENYRSNPKILKDELSLEDIKKLVNQLQPKTHFMITGGEPFLRKDIMEIIDEIKEKGFSLHILTNASLLDKKKIEKMADMRVESIGLSIDGDRKTHDMIRQEGSFNQNIKTMEIIKELGDKDAARRLDILITCAVSQYNLHCLEYLVKLAAKYNAKLIYNPLIYFKDEIEFDIEKLLEKMKQIEALAKEYKIRYLFKICDGESIVRKWYSGRSDVNQVCTYPYFALRVRPNGELSICQLLNDTIGNVKTDDLKDVVNNKKARAFRSEIRKRLRPACMRCDHLGVMKKNYWIVKHLRKLWF